MWHRHEFARKKLIYCAAGGGENDWQRSGDCLWTLATSIPGKTPINNDEGYESLKSFFLEVVGVKQLTLTMLYDKLKVPDLDISLEALKADLLEFSALISAAAFDEELEQLDPTRIRNNNIFPTRQPDGQIVRLRADVPFAIADRASLASSFRDKANLLDFSLSQVNGLGPFIRWSNLEGRYLSALVREASTVDMSSSRPISESHREIKRKAGALLRFEAIEFRRVIHALTLYSQNCCSLWQPQDCQRPSRRVLPKAQKLRDARDGQDPYHTIPDVSWHTPDSRREGRRCFVIYSGRHRFKGVRSQKESRPRRLLLEQAAKIPPGTNHVPRRNLHPGGV